MLFQFQYAAHTLVNALFAEPADLHGLDHGIEGFHEVLGAEDDVGTGLKRTYSGLGIGVLLGDASALVYCLVMAPISIASVMMIFW